MHYAALWRNALHASIASMQFSLECSACQYSKHAVFLWNALHASIASMQFCGNCVSHLLYMYTACNKVVACVLSCFCNCLIWSSLGWRCKSDSCRICLF